MRMSRALRAVWLVAGVALCAPGAVFAQSQTDGRIDVGGGLAWFGAVRYAPIDATETTPDSGHRALFKTRSKLGASAGLNARVGVRLTSRFGVETSVALNPTRLTTRISHDVEGPDTIKVSESVMQYLVEGGLIARLARWDDGRVTPFATVGAGYLRHVNDGQTLVETGRSYYVGGGAEYQLKSRGTGWVKSAGVRADIRGTFLKDGAGFDHERHLVPFVGAGLFLRF
jgi:hypothetical protein